MKKYCKDVYDEIENISNYAKIKINNDTLRSDFTDERVYEEFRLMANFLSTEYDEYFKYTNIYSIFSKYFKHTRLPDQTVCKTMFHLFKINNVLDEKDVWGKSYDYFYFAKVYSDCNLGSCWMANLANAHNLQITEDTIFDLAENYIKYRGVEALPKDVFIDFNVMKNGINVVKNLLFKKMNSFNEDDIKEVYEALKMVKVDETIALKMKDYLKKILDNRVSLNSKVEPTSVAKPRVQEKHLITDKEYRSILKEIRSVFNPYTLELISEVDPDKRAYIAGLMARIDLDEQVIKRFLQLTGEEKSYTYEYFSTHIDEFKYYYGEELDDIFAYLEEVYASLNEEDKEYWIDAINEELRKHMFDFKLGSYDYEFKKLKGM